MISVLSTKSLLSGFALSMYKAQAVDCCTNWCRIAAVIYHLFLAEDNSPELFAQAKRIHSLVPYTLMKNVIRIANPAAVMSGVLDLFLAQPFGSRSLLQRIFSMTLNDGIKSFQKSIDALATKVEDSVLCQKLKDFTDADEGTKNEIREEAAAEDIDLIVVILRSEQFYPELEPEQFGKVFNGYVAWNHAVDHVDQEMREGASWFANLKQLLKLYTRQRDKAMMLSIVEEPVTLQLFRDLFTIFYEPLVRVYKSANVYSSITDFAHFADDAISVIEKCQRQDASADPNQTVQSFIDLCERHQDNFYKFIHEVHLHDNGLFGSLMSWIEGILEFLRNGPQGGKLDMNALIHGAIDVGQVDKVKALQEINSLIQWHEDRKRWHMNKTRQKMAAEGTGAEAFPGASGFRGSDFGLDEVCFSYTISRWQQYKLTNYTGRPRRPRHLRRRLNRRGRRGSRRKRRPGPHRRGTTTTGEETRPATPYSRGAGETGYPGDPEAAGVVPGDVADGSCGVGGDRWYGRMVVDDTLGFGILGGLSYHCYCCWVFSLVTLLHRWYPIFHYCFPYYVLR